jgi:hypothetical protein
MHWSAADIYHCPSVQTSPLQLNELTYGKCHERKSRGARLTSMSVAVSRVEKIFALLDNACQTAPPVENFGTRRPRDRGARLMPHRRLPLTAARKFAEN